jgi:sec-independent protein translocase protein TatA
MSIGFKEILIVLIIAFLLFGGRRLPELGRGLGKGITNFRKALSDIEHSDEKSENHKVENEPKA